MYIFQTLTLLLPILIVGLFLILIIKNNYFSKLNKPVDCGIIFNGQPFLGSNKTWRGLLTYLIGVPIVCWLFYLIEPMCNAVLHPVFRQSPIVVGLALSLSYIFGEHLNSFIKRRINIKPGDAVQGFGHTLQYFFDSCDGIIMAVAVLIIFFHISWIQCLIAFIAGVATHLLVDILMKRLNLKK